jgi:hypothetical protein
MLKSTDCHCTCHLVDGADGGVTKLMDGDLLSEAGIIFPVSGPLAYCEWRHNLWVSTSDLNTAMLQALFAE